MNKKEIRQIMLDKRNTLSDIEQEYYSEQIAEILTKQEFYKKMKKICVYQSFRKEVSCGKITKYAFQDGKQVYVPVTDVESRTMDFYQITEDTRWVEGAYGIMEPLLSEDVPTLTEPALILMPGLVFDHAKHRIGYGGGYYDKYLAKHTEHITVALCYDFQVIEEILPYEEHDKLPDYIVTNIERF